MYRQIGPFWWKELDASSAYNALEGSLQYTAGRTSVLVSYTYSKSLVRIPAEADQHSWMKPITIPV